MLVVAIGVPVTIMSPSGCLAVDPRPLAPRTIEARRIADIVPPEAGRCGLSQPQRSGAVVMPFLNRQLAYPDGVIGRIVVARIPVRVVSGRHAADIEPMCESWLRFGCCREGSRMIRLDRHRVDAEAVSRHHGSIMVAVRPSEATLNIKDPETEKLAAEVAAITGESMTRAAKVALQERRQRLAVRVVRREELRRFLEQEVWPQVPRRLLGKRVTRPEREAILGCGPEGV